MNAYIDFQSKKIAYRDEGQGNVVVFLHGFMESGAIWNEFVRVLKEQFRVVTIDLPGHGQSDTFFGICTMGFMAGSVKAVLDHLKIEKAIVTGHSMGGYVAMALAHRFPSVLKAMVLFHSGAHADSAEAKSVRERTIAAVRADHVSFAVQFIPSLFAPQNIEMFKDNISELQEQAKQIRKEAIIASLEGMKIRTDLTALLNRVEFPVLFIAGKYDARIPPEWIEKQSKLPAESEFILLENSGHMGYIEEKSVSINALLRFFLSIC